MSEATGDTRTVVIEKTFPHSPEKLWRALTEGPLLAQWLLKNDFEPVVGRKFRFQSEPMPKWDGVIDCEVRVVEPLKELVYSWQALGLDSLVRFTLTEVAGGTQVRIEHSGFGAHQHAAYQGATYGWQNFLGKLEKLLLEAGERNERS